MTRRGFLLAAGATPLALGAEPPPVQLPPLMAPTERAAAPPFTPLPPGDRVGFAVVGLGHLSLDEILPAFGASRYAKPVALVSGDPAKAATVAKQYGIAERACYSYATFDRVKDDPAVQVVYIVLPNGLHHEYTLRSAAAGKHVLCEKPMANSVRECEEMIAACAKANRKLMIAYRCQYEPHHRAAIEIARTKLGALKLISADNGQNETRQMNWRHDKKLAGGGALPDVGIYCLNAARYLSGEEPVEVSAQVFSTPGDPRFASIEENCTFLMRFPSGLMAACTTGYGHHESRRCRVMGERGWLDLDPAFSYRGLKLKTAFAEGAAEVVGEQVLAEKNQFALEIDHMAKCVRDGTPVHTPGEEGLQDQRVIEAIYAAAASGKPVTLPKVDRRDAFRGPVPAG